MKAISNICLRPGFLDIFQVAFSKDVLRPKHYRTTPCYCAYVLWLCTYRVDAYTFDNSRI